MKKLISISVIVLIISCQKEIKFEGLSNFDQQVFIECILSPGETPKVFLSNSVSFFNEKVTPQDIFIRNAIVSISTEGQEHLLEIDSTFDKFRCRWTPFYRGDFEVYQGKSYTLSVVHDDKEYFAQTTIQQSQVNIKNIDYIEEFFDVYGGHDGVKITIEDKKDEVNYYRSQIDRWMDTSRHHAHILDVLQNDCTSKGEHFWVKDLGRSIISDEGNDGREMTFNIEVSFEYLEGDTAFVYIQSLDKKSAIFFQEMDNQLQSILNPFVEPSFLHSTIEGTLGVFGSAVKSESVMFIYPQDNP